MDIEKDFMKLNICLFQLKMKNCKGICDKFRNSINNKIDSKLFYNEKYEMK